MEQKKGNKKMMFLLIGLGVVGVAGTAYYFYEKSQQGQANPFSDLKYSGKENTPSLIPDLPQPEHTEKDPFSDLVKAASSFPLSEGSKGKLVKLIQLALIKKYGEDILPKYGADGHWGKETTNALNAKGYPVKIDKNTFVHHFGKGVLETLAINGLEGVEQLKTIRPTRIWSRYGQKLNVPKNTVIGYFTGAKNGVTTFRTLDSRTLYVATKDISYV